MSVQVLGIVLPLDELEPMVATAEMVVNAIGGAVGCEPEVRLGAAIEVALV